MRTAGIGVFGEAGGQLFVIFGKGNISPKKM
jgi:hypothetical protein